MQELEPVQRALVVTPHPDDAEFGCAGTVALLVREGKEVFFVVATSGNKGGRDTDMTADYLTDARQDEQRRAAEVLGVSEVVFLDFGDGELGGRPRLPARACLPHPPPQAGHRVHDRPISHVVLHPQGPPHDRPRNSGRGVPVCA